MWIGLVAVVLVAGGAGGFWYLDGRTGESQPLTLQFADGDRDVNEPATPTTTSPPTSTITTTTTSSTGPDDDAFVQVWTVRAPVAEGEHLVDARRRLRLAVRTIPVDDAPSAWVEDLAPPGLILTAARDLRAGEILTDDMVASRPDELIAVWVATQTIEPVGDRVTAAIADGRLERRNRHESELPGGFVRADVDLVRQTPEPGEADEPSETDGTGEPAEAVPAGEPGDYEFVRTLRVDSTLTWSHLVAVP